MPRPDIPALRSSPSAQKSSEAAFGEPVAQFPGSVIRVCALLLDPMRAEGLRALFDSNSGIEILIEEAPRSQLGNLWFDPSIRVAILGAQIGDVTATMVKSMRLARPDLQILVMSPAAGDEAVLSVLALGVKGFLHDSASAAEFEKAVRVVASGCIWATRKVQSMLIERLLRGGDVTSPIVTPTFTKREQQVLSLLLDGRSNREIASSLDIEERTVKAYVASLMAKVGVKNRTALSMRTLSKAGPES